MSEVTPICPTDCGSTVGDVSFNDCSKTARFGEIEKIWVKAKNGAPLSGFGTLAFVNDLLSRIVQVGTDVNDIRQLTVSADMPVPSRDEIIMSGNTKVMTPGDFVINVDIDDVTLMNYDFARKTQCMYDVDFWFATPTMIFGGNYGISAVLMLDVKIDRGAKVLNMLTGTIKWTNQFMPEAMENLLT